MKDETISKIFVCWALFNFIFAFLIIESPIYSIFEPTPQIKLVFGNPTSVEQENLTTDDDIKPFAIIYEVDSYRFYKKQ